MSGFNIFNMASGEELGHFFAHSPEEAMNAMARTAGFADYQDARRQCPAMHDQLMVTEL